MTESAATAATSFSVNLAGPYPYSGLQVLGLFLLGLFPLLSITACVLWVWSRRLCQGLGLALYMRANYCGVHDIDIHAHPTNKGLIFAYLNRVSCSPLLAMVKISALLFPLGVGGTKHLVDVSCRVLILLNILQVRACLPATIFNCKPVEYVWTKPTGQKKGLRLGWKIRAALLTVFASVAVCSVTCISIIRLYSVIRVWHIKPPDGHYTIGYTTDIIEVNLAIVTSMGINRPYVYPDIEVQVRASMSQQMRSPPLRAEILWLQRGPHTPITLGKVAVVERDKDDDYHGIIRRANSSTGPPIEEQNDENFLIIQKTEPNS
ncbi:hypothetical protein QBC40DRAFT_326498 [Triangularia verruculosa]|uniref:Rhodopsin domain-containing protein n=1 Tax=Triangularia verruculosa TaxID=2587418 RepID=A0AAN6XI08_9PEZI|nr:hypothetical protein QBC40DRAFT_326498 [Triangularia verruculosa]